MARARERNCIECVVRRVHCIPTIFCLHSRTDMNRDAHSRVHLARCSVRLLFEKVTHFTAPTIVPRSEILSQMFSLRLSNVRIARFIAALSTNAADRNSRNDARSKTNTEQREGRRTHRCLILCIRIHMHSHTRATEQHAVNFTSLRIYNLPVDVILTRLETLPDRTFCAGGVCILDIT